MNKRTTTIRIYKESHRKLSLFLQENGLKSVCAVSTALARVIKEKPNFFIPESMNKHSLEGGTEKASLTDEGSI